MRVDVRKLMIGSRRRGDKKTEWFFEWEISGIARTYKCIHWGMKNHEYVLQSIVSTPHDSEAAISFTPWGDRMSHKRGLLGVNAYSKLETRSLRRLVTMGPKES